MNACFFLCLLKIYVFFFFFELKGLRNQSISPALQENAEYLRHLLSSTVSTLVGTAAGSSQGIDAGMTLEQLHCDETIDDLDFKEPLMSQTSGNYSTCNCAEDKK